jgi:hypothetical protein
MQNILIKLFGLLLVLFVVIAAASAAEAAPAAEAPAGASLSAGPFDGIFYGWVQGDHGSQALMILDLTHRDETVEGKVYLGEGLVVDAGVCGSAAVPSGVQAASGQTSPGAPDEFNADAEFQITGLEIGVEIASQVSADGESLTAEARIDLPWFCGTNPVLSGTLIRYHPQ